MRTPKTATATSHRAIFRKAYAATSRKPQDSEASARFYASCAGYVAVCDAMPRDPGKYDAYEALCTTQWVPQESAWKTLCRAMAQDAEKPLPPRPLQQTPRQPEPSFPVSRLFEIASEHYKKKYPSGNIRHSQALAFWQACLTQAAPRIEQDYQAAWHAWRTQEEERAEQERAALKTWQAVCTEQLRQRQFIAEFIGA